MNAPWLQAAAVAADGTAQRESAAAQIGAARILSTLTVNIVDRFFAGLLLQRNEPISGVRC